MATLRLAAATALVAAVSAQFAPKRGQYFWRIPDTGMCSAPPRPQPDVPPHP